MKKKIVFIIPFLSGGGAENVVSILSSEISKQNIDVSIIVFYRIEKEYFIDHNVKIIALSSSKDEYDNHHIFKKIIKLRQKLIELKPNAIFPFITHVGIMTTIATIGLNLNVIETIRIDPNYSPKKKIMRLARDTSVYLSKMCLVQNIEQKKYFSKKIQQKIFILPNPISNDFKNICKKWKEKKIKNIIAVGRLEEQKNYLMLINAISKIVKDGNDINLKIFGEGSQKKILQKQIVDCNMERFIRLCGRTDNIKNELLKSDLYILSSVAEGMPNSLMEAMAIGLPCISTDCPTGPSELINNHNNGLLISNNCEDELCSAIMETITNIDDAIKMGKEARKSIFSKYDANIISKKLIALITKEE